MVARYNPCGAVVDIGRRTYRTRARLYPDSDEEFEIEWYEARPDAPILPFPSALNGLEWEIDREEWLPTAVGEVYGAPVVFTSLPPRPAALGNHQCGTAADFGGYGTYRPDLPPVEYRPDGLPACCGNDIAARGGAVGGGTAVVAYTGPTGGAVGGGIALVTYTGGPTGGAVGGGTAPAGYTPPITGGAVGGGTAWVGTGEVVEGSGGAVGGGTAWVGTGDVIEGSGGAVGGGSAEVAYVEVIEGSGGAVGGGSAEVAYVDVIEGSGGAVGGGSAEVEYIPPGYGCEQYGVTWNSISFVLDRVSPLTWVGIDWVLTADGIGGWTLVNTIVAYTGAVGGWDGTGSQDFGSGGTAHDATVTCAD